jgi:hypothetical protein
MLTLMHYFPYLDAPFQFAGLVVVDQSSGLHTPLVCHPVISGYGVWCMVKERVYSRKVRNISELKCRIQTVVSSIPCEMCVRALNATVARWFLC